MHWRIVVIQLSNHRFAVKAIVKMCIISPLEVFKVTTYLWLVPGFTVSNSVFVLFAIIGACWVLTWISLSLETIVPTAWQAMIEMMHSTVSSMIDPANCTNAFTNRVYVPLFLTFFLWKVANLALSNRCKYGHTLLNWGQLAVKMCIIVKQLGMPMSNRAVKWNSRDQTSIFWHETAEN